MSDSEQEEKEISSINFVNEKCRPMGLEVRKSLIKDAGLGLFALREFQKGQDLCNYEGNVLRSVTESQCKRGYILQLSQHYFIDAESFYSGPARFINDNLKSKSKINTCFVVNQRQKTCAIRAIKTIKPNSEIYVKYGKDYWEED